MIKVAYDPKPNVVIVEFIGKIDEAQSKQFFRDIQNVIPKCGKGFKLLTDLSAVQEMDAEVLNSIKKGMDLFNAQGVTEILRVIPDPSQDIGFNILSPFHYSKNVNILTVPSREEAQARL